MKVKNITMRTSKDNIAKAFNEAFKYNKPVNLKTDKGYHYAIGDLYFKIEDGKTYSYQLDKKMWVELEEL